ncbi:hypothetical protein PHLCEN_2v9925 [Hermanssonia centrifuga]|uniref:AAA+ ATPase domain-containing protein n=1 Tax=Hermanssonia centrifuga TaxID=98765 RepID=A0A2R6NPA1_9APHY|nr:hypothetical protein PHLCEN_2v9925 [Hermanssonia centrifuga]
MARQRRHSPPIVVRRVSRSPSPGYLPPPTVIHSGDDMGQYIVSASLTGDNDEPSQALSSYDLSKLELGVNRIRSKWDQSKNCYVIELDSQEDNDGEDGPPKYPPTHAFTIFRTFTPTNNPLVFSISKKIHVWSPYFVEVAKAVMGEWMNISWSAKPVVLDPNDVLVFLPKFKKHLRLPQSEPEIAVTVHLAFFLGFIEKEYENTLATLRSLLEERKISFELLWGLFLPGTILITHCRTTGELLAVRLRSCVRQCASFSEPQHWLLTCEYVDVDKGLPGYTDLSVKIHDFPGVEVITDLPIFPMDPYVVEPRRSELCEILMKRGQRRWELSRSWSHNDYDAIAYTARRADKMNIKSRIILDREKFIQYAYGDPLPTVKRDLDGKIVGLKVLSTRADVRRVDMTAEEFLLMPAKLYGFSLGDRKWLIFNVDNVQDIRWNLEAFERLDIPENKKVIVQTLIESHTQKAATFDDFVPGKGLGLIFALHGPPGVGKTLTAEATSEVARSPLYMVGAGDLGTSAQELDSALTTLFALASAWKAIVLIDEADVFLEKRDVHDLVRNSMVAVFLRQLEYYTGILILNEST